MELPLVNKVCGRTIFLVVTFVVLMSGCCKRAGEQHESPSQLNSSQDKLVVGMTKSEVMALRGSPARIMHDASGLEIWMYHLKGEQLDGSTATHVIVAFEKEKVCGINYGKTYQ